MLRRYALRDDQWERIKDFLPGRPGHVGANARNNRLFVEAVLWRYRSGAPWRTSQNALEISGGSYPFFPMVQNWRVETYFRNAGGRRRQ